MICHSPSFSVQVVKEIETKVIEIAQKDMKDLRIFFFFSVHFYNSLKS